MTSKPDLKMHHSKSKSPSTKSRHNKIQKHRIPFTTDTEREEKSTIFSIRENLMKNINDSHMDNLQEIQANSKQKRDQSDLKRYPTTENEKSEQTSYYLSRSALATPNKGDGNVSVNQSINSINTYDLDSKQPGKGNREGFKSANRRSDHDSRWKAKIMKIDESLSNISDDLGDEEPEFPIIVRKGKIGDQAGFVNLEEQASFVYNNHNYNHVRSKKKEAFHFPWNWKQENLKAKKRNSCNEESDFTPEEIARFERYVGIRPKKLDLDLERRLAGKNYYARSTSQPQSRRMNENSAVVNNSNRNEQGFLPRLNIKALTPGAQKYIGNSTRRDAMEPIQFTYSIQKQRPPSRLERTVPVGRAASDTRKQLNESYVVSNASMLENSENKKPSRASNLLSNITREQRTSFRSDLNQKKQNFSHANDETSLSRSDKSKNSSINTLKIPILRHEESVVNSNRLLRSLYRVKNGSTGAFSERSDENLSRGQMSKSGSPSLQHELVDKGVQTDLRESRKENRGKLEVLKLNLGEKVKSAGIRNRHSSITSIHRNISNMNTPSQVRSFGQDSYLGSVTKRNRSVIEKFNKNWEDQKKKVEWGINKEASFIQFQGSGNPIIPRSKGVSFQKAMKLPLFSGMAKTPGPGKYKTASPMRNIGYSFRSGKQFDITGLPLIEDMNRMLDPIRQRTKA